MVKKLVSVLIPVYNVEKYVEEAIRSIQVQTYRKIEIVVVDDGSTDNTYEIVKKMASEDSRIKLLKNKKNSRIVKTLNKALGNSSGEYIARMDGDDISAPDRIERKVKFLEENPSFHLVGCSVNAISDSYELLSRTIKYGDFELLDKIKKYSTPAFHIWVARREVYDALGGYRELPGVEDYDFLLRLATHGFKFTNIEDYFGYNIRVNREGNTKDLIGLRQILLHRYAYNLYRQRKRFGKDDFESNFKSCSEVKPIYDDLYNFSRAYLVKAIERKRDKKYIAMLFFIVFSLVSPHQLYYLKNKALSRLIPALYKSLNA